MHDGRRLADESAGERERARVMWNLIVYVEDGCFQSNETRLPRVRHRGKHVGK